MDTTEQSPKPHIGFILKRLHARLSPIGKRRLENFASNRRGYWSFRMICYAVIVCILAPIIANDKPILMSYKGELLAPILFDYPESKFGGFLAVSDYRSEYVYDEIESNGWMLWPPIHYYYNTVNYNTSLSAPALPSWLLSPDVRCDSLVKGQQSGLCSIGSWNWLGQDDNGRDVVARLLYGVQTSLLFGIIVTFLASIIGIIAGAVQGYFGGLTDLIFQRLIEIWNSVPYLYIIMILASLLTQNFWVIAVAVLLFSWVNLVGLVRAEFLRGRNLDYVRAAVTLGVSNTTIIFKHILPNAMVATLTYLPFMLTGTIGTLTALDYLGFGLPPGAASLGEVLLQGKNNLQAPWIAISGFVTLSVLLSLLVFIGEAVRDAFDPNK